MWELECTCRHWIRSWCVLGVAASCAGKLWLSFLGFFLPLCLSPPFFSANFLLAAFICGVLAFLFVPCFCLCWVFGACCVALVVQVCPVPKLTLAKGKWGLSALVVCMFCFGRFFFFLVLWCVLGVGGSLCMSLLGFSYLLLLSLLTAIGVLRYYSYFTCEWLCFFFLIT